MNLVLLVLVISDLVEQVKEFCRQKGSILNMMITNSRVKLRQAGGQVANI